MYGILYGIILSCYTEKMMFPLLPPPECTIPIVGIIETNNGRTCDVHRFGCGNSLLLARPVLGCGVLLRLKQTMAPNELAAYFVLCDGSDGCRVGFTSREHAVGARGQMLDGVLVRLIEVFTMEHPNSYCRVLYHRNRGYALAEIVDNEDKVGQNENCTI